MVSRTDKKFVVFTDHISFVVVVIIKPLFHMLKDIRICFSICESIKEYAFP
jgi:hypothetical protein